MPTKCPVCQNENPDNSLFCFQCGSRLPLGDNDPTLDTLPYQDEEISEWPVQELIPGTLFARRYLVLEKLGEGGMGSVYRVLDKEIDSKIALKLILSETSFDERTIAQFRNELKTARSIIHKNVCRMFDLNKYKDQYYITMEYVPGQDLKNMLKMTQRLSVETSVDMAVQICEGLQEAHQLGVIHRDLKPSNIMIDKDGRVRILDFGLARSLKDEIQSGSDKMVGTPNFMSPEQVDGKGIDQRSDIYSLGTILFQMLTGKLPFYGESLQQVILKQKYKIPPDPKKLNPQIPEDLCRIILKCLNKNKEKRFSSVQELQAELNALNIKRKLSPEAGMSPEPVAAKKRKWLPVAGGMTLVLAVAVLIGLYFFQDFFFPPSGASLSSQEKMLAVLPFENLGFQEDEYFADGLTEELTNRLSALHGLGVISRISTQNYKNSSKTISRIGKELSVDYILEGTVRWNRNSTQSDRIIVTTQLVKTSDETQIWGEKYDEVMEDIFALQTRIAEEVAKKLDVEVLGPERAALNANPTSNIEAFDFYLKAREYYNSAYLNQSYELYSETIKLLGQAIHLDENFTSAYVNLYYTHMQMHMTGIDRSDERLNMARAALIQAEDLDPDLPKVRLCRAHFYMNGLKDYENALEIYQDVQRARPNLPPYYLSHIHRLQGHWKEAVIYMEKAFRLSPLSFDYAHLLGRLYAWIGQYDRSEEWFDRALSIYPDLYYSKLGKARLPLLAEGDTERSRLLTESLPPHILTDYHFFELGLLEKKYQDVLELLARTSYDSFKEAHFYFSKKLSYAWDYHEMGDSEKRNQFARAACEELRKSLIEHPEDTRIRAALGLSYGFLGQKEEAVREGIQAANMVPLSQNAFEGPRYILNLARIYLLVGDKENALNQLEYLFSHPCGNVYTIPILKIDPFWDSLRQNPRFIRLLDDPEAVFRSELNF